MSAQRSAWESGSHRVSRRWSRTARSTRPQLARRLNDDGSAVQEIARVLRPGGHAVFLEPAFNALLREHDELTHGIRRYRRTGLEGLATAAGLHIVRSTYAKSFLFPAAALIAVSQRVARRFKAQATPRSDLEARSVDGIATPILQKLAQLEHRILQRRNIPFGTSVVVVAAKR